MLYVWGSKKAVASVSKYLTKNYRSVRHKTIEFDGKMPKLRPGDSCLGLGGAALVELSRAGLVPKNRSIRSARSHSIPVYAGKASFFVTYDPAFVAKEYERKPDIEWDIALAVRFAERKTIDPEIGMYTYVDDSFDRAMTKIHMMAAKTRKPVPIAIDLETVGLTAFDERKHIVSISITYQEGQADVIRFHGSDDPKAPPQNERLMANLTKLANDTELVMVRGANFKFDMLWMAVKWGMPVNWPTFSFDTTVVGSLLDENRSNSLNLHAKLFTPIGGYDDQFNKNHDKSRMDLVPPGDLLTYAGGDTDATLRVSKVFVRDLLRDRKLMVFYQKLMHPAIKAFAVMEHRGMIVDRNRYEELDAEVRKAMRDAENSALQMMPRMIRAKYSDDLKISRPSLITDFMFGPRGLGLKPKMLTEKTKAPSTSVEHLEMFDHPEAKAFVEQYKLWQSAQKTRSTYIKGFMVHLHTDGKFHPSYMLHRGDYKNDMAGSVTRTSAKDPAYQTIPKHTKWAKPLRSVYVAPPGYCVMNVDYSQGELRVTACVANESTMLAVYRAGEDLHLLTGAESAGIPLAQAKQLPPDEQAELRQGGKAGNFGLIYGMQPPGFVEYARSTFGMEMSLSAAESFRNRFFGKYRGLTRWHEAAIEYARKHKQIRSPLGRLRRLPMISSWDWSVRSRQERQAINSQIQSTLSDMGLLAIALLYERYPDLWVFGFTHDAISCYVPEDEIVEWGRRIRDVMENLPLHEFGWRPQLKFPVDVEVGQRMDDMKKIAID